MELEPAALAETSATEARVELKPEEAPAGTAKEEVGAEPERLEEVEVQEGIEVAKRPSEKVRRLEPRVKRIEKITAEPARIISRPKLVEPPPAPKVEAVKPAAEKPAPGPTPPQRPRPVPMETSQRLRPVPVETPQVLVIEPIEEAPGLRGKKKKKGRDTAATELDAARKAKFHRREVIEKHDLYDTAEFDRPTRVRKGARAVKKVKKTEITTPKAIKRRIRIVEAITVADLAKKMSAKATDIVRKLMAMGLIASLNQAIDYDTAALVASEFGYEVEQGAFDEEEVLQVPTAEATELRPRPPVVTVMGHVDHGKTMLLDAIRKTNVIEGEAGGITQHIGAYHVEGEGGSLTFLDTPGHAAFTSMRARGAQVTDIVVLVIAADDGVMQQTKEAIDHARAAGVPIVVAVNKVDKPEANAERIRREMADLGLMPESWGGDTIFVDISAKTGQGIDELMDMILLQAEVLELKTDAVGRAKGHLIEARLDKGRGPVATVLVQSGRLKLGDPFVCGVFHGRVRAMFNDKSQRVEEARPSQPVEIQGISGVPLAGDEFIVVEDDKKAKQVSQHRQLKQRETELLKTSKLTLENLFDSIKSGKVKNLNLVLKADVQGSVEAISEALKKLPNDQIKIDIIRASTGAVTDNDILLASASEALIVCFNIRPGAKVQELADEENIQIRYYDVIYQLIDEIKVAMAGLLDPIKKELILGRAEVRQPFHVSKVGTVAGSTVTDGKIVRGAKARLLRDDVVVFDGRINSLKRYKEDAREVLSGYECGISLENFNDIKIGDIVEAY
ncbi:MAG: translation initiation factor IF-2, partial [Pseudomonadota bacterium]